MNFHDLRDLENKVTVTRFFLGLCLILVVLCTKFSETLPSISSDIKWNPFQINLNHLCDLGKKDKVTRFNSGPLLALVPLCTKFGEDTSNNSSGIEQKLSFISCRLE